MKASLQLSFLFPILACLLCVGSQARGESPYKITPDVVYGHKAGMALTFDVIQPKEPNGAGVMFMVSGAWVSMWVAPDLIIPSDISGRGHLFSQLLDRGYTVFIVRHGSAPQFKVPEAVADVRRAVRYIRLNADDFDVDPERLGVCGGSAGGHLSLMLGTTGEDGDEKSNDPIARESSEVAAVVAYFPPVDLREWVGDKRFEALHFDPKLAESVSPLLHVSPDDAPTLLVHGDEDDLVKVNNSERILAAFEKEKVPCNLIVLKGAGHHFPDDYGQRATKALVDWFDKHLATDASSDEAQAAAPPAVPAADGAIRAAVEAVLHAQEEAWNRGDIEAFMEHYWKRDDLTFSSGGKTTRGWQATLKHYHTRYPTRDKMGRLTLSGFEITPLGDSAALALGQWKLDRVSEPIAGNLTLVVRKLDGRWVIVHDHTSRLAD
jgi:uncharacterized protein (TIGR02246 family)